MKKVPIHVDSNYNNLYVTYLDENNKKQFDVIDDFEYEIYMSKKDDHIIDKKDAKRFLYSTREEKQYILDQLGAKGYNDYLGNLVPYRQYYLREFGRLKSLPRHDIHIGFIDIEVLMEGKFTLDGKFPLTTISVGDYTSKKIYTFGWHEVVEDVYENEDKGLFLYNNEKDAVDQFIKYMNEQKFDIITGWNFCEGEMGSGFDNPYLINRLKKLKREKKLSPFGIVKKKYRTEDYEIFGLPSIDYLTVYRKFRFKELPSYSLAAVAEEENIESKVSFEGSLNDLYKNDFVEYIRYNRRDVKIMMELEDRYKYFDLISEIRSMSFVNYNVINNSTLIDNILIKHLKDKGKIAISRKYNDDVGIPGAYVKEPKVGMYDWVVDLDYTSLYPFIIMNMNISPDTKRGNVTNWDDIIIYEPSATDDENDAVNIIDPSLSADVVYNNSFYQFSHEELKQFLVDNNLIISNHGVLFSKDEQGIFPEILTWIFQQRKQYKESMIKASKRGDKVNKNLYFNKQLAFKILLNSFYGFVSFTGSRFYDTDLGSSITMTGRKLIRYAIQKATNSGYMVITTDTDSILFTNTEGFKDEFEAIEAGASLGQDIDNQLIPWCKDQFNIDNSSFHIKQEIVARRGVFFAKKRYSLWKINQEGVSIDEVEYKGIDIVRNSTPPAIRTYLVDIFDSALKLDDSKGVVYEKIDKYKKELLDLDVEDIGIRCSLTKDLYTGYTKNLPIHVRGALVYEVINEGNVSFENEIKGRYYFLNVDAKTLKDFDDEPDLKDKLIGNGKTKLPVLSIPNNSTFVLDREDVDYVSMENRLLNKPLQHLINVYEVQDLNKFVDVNRDTNQNDIFNLLYNKIKKRNIQIDKKIIKKHTNKNFSEKYYDLSNIFIIVEKLLCSKEEFVEFLNNKLAKE